MDNSMVPGCGLRVSCRLRHAICSATPAYAWADSTVWATVTCMASVEYRLLKTATSIVVRVDLHFLAVNADYPVSVANIFDPFERKVAEPLSLMSPIFGGDSQQILGFYRRRTILLCRCEN